MNKLSVVAAFSLTLFLAASCKGPCRKYEDLLCKDPGSMACLNAQKAIKTMTPEECKNAVIGLESQNALEDLDNDKGMVPEQPAPGQ